jgi:hypothetical protein
MGNDQAFLSSFRDMMQILAPLKEYMTGMARLVQVT